MSLKKPESTQKRGAQIDNTTTNMIIVILISVILLLVILFSYLAITLAARSKITDKDLAALPSLSTGDHPYKVDGITVNIPKAEDAKHPIDADTISSANAFLYDITANEVIASRQGGKVIYPASMTKVMSLIVIVENLNSESSLNDTFTVTQEMYDRKVSEGHSGDFNTVGETMTVKDAIYAFILDSDGMLGIGLANYIAGSEAAFVSLMNDKATEMGLENTFFQNCTGMHHVYHYTTCRDMAAIMTYAMQNPLCAEILSRDVYRTTTNVHPSISFYHDLLVTRFEKYPVSFSSVEIVAGKTGWTGNVSGYCVVSYAKGDNGHSYILVTAGAQQKLSEIIDMATIYNQYVD